MRRETNEAGNAGMGASRRRRLRGLAVLALALVQWAAACSGEDPLAPEWGELARAERLWAASGPDSYEYVYTPSCFCPYTPRRVTVRAGEVVVVDWIDPDASVSGAPELEGFTVVQLLERVEEELRRDPFRARLEFHSTLGYPVDVWFDYEENVVDEEWGFAVTGLRALD